MLKNHTLLKLKTPDTITFSEEEKVVRIEPMLIVIVIPYKYTEDFMFNVLHALMTKGIKMIATVMSAIIPAINVETRQIR